MTKPDLGNERNRRRAEEQPGGLRVWKSVTEKEGKKGMTVVNFGMGVNKKEEEIKRKERSMDASMGLGLGMMRRDRRMGAGSGGMGSVTVVPVLSPPESSISHTQQTTTSGSSSSSSSASSSNASSTCTTPINLRGQGEGGSASTSGMLEDDSGRPKGSFWANYPARPGLSRSSSPMTTNGTIIATPRTNSTASTSMRTRRSSSASAGSSYSSSSFDRQGRRPRATLTPICPGSGSGGRYSRGRSAQIKGNAGGYYYYTPFPSPYTLDGVDSDADEEEDQPDEMIRAKDHKWFLAPRVECERAVGGSTIVRRSSGASVSVSPEGRGSSVELGARKLSRRSMGRRPRFKLFHMEDDIEDKTTHQEKNEGSLSVLLGGDGGTVAEACGESERPVRAARRGVQDSRMCGLSRGDWPLCSVDASPQTHDSDSTPRSPLSRHIDITSICWRGRDYARYERYLQCRASPSFRAFMQMTEDHVDVHESPMDTFLFSVQLSFISTSDDQDANRRSLPPPRRRSDGDLLRKRVLEWNMVLNGKVSNVRAREDKAPRDSKRRSSCPAKLSAMRAIEEEEGDGDYEGDDQFEQESPPEMDEDCDWFDRRHFQNR